MGFEFCVECGEPMNCDDLKSTTCLSCLDEVSPFEISLEPLD